MKTEIENIIYNWTDEIPHIQWRAKGIQIIKG